MDQVVRLSRYRFYSETEPTPDAAREPLLLDDCVLVKAAGTLPFNDSEAGGSFPKYDHFWHEEDGAVSAEVIFYSLQFCGTDVARVHAEPAPTTTARPASADG